MPIVQVERDDDGETAAVLVELPNGRAEGLWVIELEDSEGQCDRTFVISHHEWNAQFGASSGPLASWTIPVSAMAERVVGHVDPQSSLELDVLIAEAINRHGGADFGSVLEVGLADLIGWRMAGAVARRFATKGKPGTENTRRRKRTR